MEENAGENVQNQRTLNISALTKIMFFVKEKKNCQQTASDHTPPIAEILCVKNGRAIVVCGFLIKSS